MSESIKSQLRDILKVALPVSLGQLGHVLANVVDNLMLSRFDSETLIDTAAATFALSVFFPLFLLNVGYSMGITPLVSNKLGENNRTELKELFVNSFWANLMMGVVSAVVFVACSPLMAEMGQPESIVPKATTYFQLMMISMIPVMIFQSGKQFAEAFSDTNYAMYVSLLGNALNVILNYPLIFGIEGVIEPMGIVGAGIATLFCRVVMAVAMMGYLIKYSACKEYVSFKIDFLKKKVIWFLSKMSFPIGFQFMIEVSAFTIATIFVGWWKSEELILAHQIAFNVASVTFIIATGLGAAASVKVGYYWGGKNTKMVVSSFRLVILIVILYMLLCIALMLLTRFSIPTFYTHNQFVIETVASVLIVAALFQLSDGIQLVCNGALRGLNDVTTPMYIAVISYWFISLPVGYFLAFELDYGLSGIWWGFVAGLSSSAILLWLRFRYVITK